MVSVTSQEILKCLIGYLRLRKSGSIVMPSVHVGSSPWESDAITVTAAGYWSEYEIKVSMSDYRADFRKRQFGFRRNSLLKHEAYGAEGPIVGSRFYRDRQGVIPKPKQFYFVVPAGMLKVEDVPKHCGVLEWDVANGRMNYGFKVSRKSPNLNSPTVLGAAEMFALARKAAWRFSAPSLLGK